MRRMSRSTLLALTLTVGVLASGCVVAPVTTESFDPDCRVVVHHMELQNVVAFQLRGCQDSSCQLAVLASVYAASAVISGSIVLIGNVVYWGEHQVKCPPPLLAQAASAPA
jgi:hypothetical protein